MAITEFQRTLCRLIASNRIESGESYVAGGMALGVVVDTPRLSRDVDLFHDTEAALAFTWEADRRLLEAHQYSISVVRERPSFVEALVSRDDETLLLQWACDSAFRFFPLMEHPDFGLTLHAFDLATNKALALVGRLEPRDWFDLIECHRRVQPLGYLVWAACGKDPGWSPERILNEARRSARYTQDELDELSFEGATPNAVELAAEWRTALEEAAAIHSQLPSESAGHCVLSASGMLFRESSADLKDHLRGGTIIFHRGAIRGAWPTVHKSPGTRGQRI